MTAAALFSSRIVIQQKTSTRNAIGEEVDAWSTFATVWAAYRPARVQERQQGSQLGTQVDAIFRIRKLAGVTSEMRILWSDQLWDLAGPPMLMSARTGELELYATSGIRDGR